ncbi:hypothetical protein HELRODRAFT_177435 [Helobdella robusta]|uniref:FLYWCH-type domain-containing protein n=1 Tax=Helobdella robusta TaxID=6412 RepID=T1FBP6_HELRO|nr:hypothetical protein HELRODRAFT_177435 [Helobdella robusta]ESN98187.1 hypothetical protein HELRODRAFT_177435 [Helobdella robusta]
MSLEFVYSEKGKRKLIDSGHLFVKDAATEEKTFWKCDQYQNLVCRARLHTRHDKIVKRVGEHNHAGNAARVEVVKVVNQMKNDARETQDVPQRIITNSFISLSQAASGLMPNISILKKTIRNTRRLADRAPPNPNSLVDLVIPNDYQITHHDDQFLMFDSNDGWHRAFSELIGASHPTVWKFISSLKDEQALNEGKIEQYVAGANPPPSKKVYRDTAVRIKRIVQDYDNRDRMDYLRGLAHNFNFKAHLS